jgi:hypothetical protein
LPVKQIEIYYITLGRSHLNTLRKTSIFDRKWR